MLCGAELSNMGTGGGCDRRSAAVWQPSRILAWWREVRLAAPARLFDSRYSGGTALGARTLLGAALARVRYREFGLCLMPMVARAAVRSPGMISKLSLWPGDPCGAISVYHRHRVSTGPMMLPRFVIWPCPRAPFLATEAATFARVIREQIGTSSVRRNDARIAPSKA